MTKDEQQAELLKCLPDDPSRKKPWRNVNPCGYFIDKYVKIYDEGMNRWIPFNLWPAQWDALETLLTNGRVVILKGRQQGITWLCLSVALWFIVCFGGVSIALYSMREDEAEDLLRKLRDMYNRLPKWFTRGRLSVKEATTKLWIFHNDTKIRAMSTNSGDSYQFTFGVVDEAALTPDLRQLLVRLTPALDSVESSILALVSRPNKEKPVSEFNDLYKLGKVNFRKAARRWEDWVSIFIPWYENPTKTKEWYEGEKAQQLEKARHLDDLFTSYPATDRQALMPSASNKRILGEFVDLVSADRKPLIKSADLMQNLKYPGDLTVYFRPKEGVKYVIGVDCAEGLPTSNNTAIIVVRLDTGEEQACLIGKLSPRDTAHDANVLSLLYNDAGILVERNNHGHACLLKLEDLDGYLLDGPDDYIGFRSSKQTKIDLYTNLAEMIKERALEREVFSDILADQKITASQENCPPLIYTSETAIEIMSIERKTLRAPENMLDDRADAFAMAQFARSLDLVHGVERADYLRF